jgi:hypothetical protein
VLLLFPPNSPVRPPKVLVAVEPPSPCAHISFYLPGSREADREGATWRSIAGVERRPVAKDCDRVAGLTYGGHAGSSRSRGFEPGRKRLAYLRS